MTGVHKIIRRQHGAPDTGFAARRLGDLVLRVQLETQKRRPFGAAPFAIIPLGADAQPDYEDPAVSVYTAKVLTARLAPEDCAIGEICLALEGIKRFANKHGTFVGRTITFANTSIRVMERTE